jgi:hypothetical protein
MKISRSAPQPPATPAKAAGTVGKSSGEFAKKLAKAQSAKAPSHSTKATGPSHASDISDIGAALKAGTMTQKDALDKVVERVLARQLGKGTPTATRDKIGAALRESLADDPLLAEKIRSLGRD